MTPEAFAAALDTTLEDHKLSRSEKRALSDMLSDVSGDEQQMAHFRKLAFEKAAQAAPASPQFLAILQWLEGVIKVLQPQASAPKEERAEAHFSPGEAPMQRLVSFLTFARQSLDICVFTITDNRLSNAIIEAHRRGVAVRIITDDEKSEDAGSDIEDLMREGIPLRMDNSSFHMHHKFAIADRKQLVTGSYNWTRSACKYNEENFVIVSDPRLLESFQQEFDLLWSKYDR